MNFTPKERLIFDFLVKVNGDPHSVTDEDIAAIRSVGTTDAEMVEAIETLNSGNNTNVFCDALRIGSDPFLSYATEYEGAK